jgi:flagellar FliJ protein
LKRFVFGLEKILRLRNYAEQEARLELGRAVGALAEIETSLKYLAEARFIAAEEQVAEGTNADTIRHYMYYIARLDSEKERLLKEAALAERKVEEARAVYVEAAREKKAMEKLKEKKEREYKKNTLREEQKTMDDIPGAKARQTPNT